MAVSYLESHQVIILNVIIVFEYFDNLRKCL